MSNFHKILIIIKFYPTEEKIMAYDCINTISGGVLEVKLYPGSGKTDFIKMEFADRHICLKRPFGNYICNVQLAEQIVPGKYLGKLEHNVLPILCA